MISNVLENLTVSLSVNNNDNCDHTFLNVDEKMLDTPYYQPDKFNKTKREDQFSILNLNIRSMNSNFSNFLDFYKNIKFCFDVICITETWEEKEAPLSKNSLFNLPRYKLVSQPRTSSKGGGVCIYVLNKHNFEIKKKCCITNNNIESIGIEIFNLKEKNIIVNCVYRPPSGKISLFNSIV